MRCPQEMHSVLGEPLTDEECSAVFQQMDADRAGHISFDDFLTW